MPDAQEDDNEDEFEDEEDEDEEDDDAEEEDEEDSDDSLATPKRGTHGSKTVLVKPTTPFIQRNKPSTEHIPSPITFSKGSGVKVRNVDAENKLRTRGIPDFDKIGGHEPRLKNLFGPDGQHLRPVLSSRDYWSAQETFPIRKSESGEPGGANFGSLRRSFFEKEGAREKENEALRQWYMHTGKATFEAAQSTEELSKDEAKQYMLNAGLESLNVLTGPLNAPKVDTLTRGSYMHIAQSFPDKTNRRGWLFNLGSRIQDAQWVTKEDSRVQYLAVAVEQRPMGEHQPKPMEVPKAPAFSATDPYMASIQIWAFEATEEGEMDSSIEPRLELVVCANWGAPKQLRWCPVAATSTEANSNTEKETHIGMLAVSWSDGRVRILDLYASKRQAGEGQTTTYLYFSQAAFEVSFPQTVPSCLHWLSGTTLAVATAAGTVGIWTLSRPGTLSTRSTNESNPRPWFYQQLADTFILTISSAWPSNPQFLSISTADGFARLFDLRSPNADTAASIRGRTLCLTQAWHEHTQSFVMPDEHYILRHTPLRRYYHNLYSMRLDNSITRVATSPVHPGVLVGGTDGDVETSNPVMRIANYKVVPWQQKWFVHEWRGPIERMLVKPMTETSHVDNDDDMAGQSEKVEHPLTTVEEDTSVATAAAAAPQPPSTEAQKVSKEILSQPLVRISEGYKAVQQGIAHSSVSKRKGNPEIGRSISIFEEQSAVTALAWNPNLRYGTWAVAGMGSGLLRVEDVGITEKRK
jgi:transcription factor C subunit 6